MPSQHWNPLDEANYRAWNSNSYMFFSSLFKPLYSRYRSNIEPLGGQSVVEFYILLSGTRPQSQVFFL